ncbi:MAG: hypothetical protein AAF492_26655, partial [Verrucomicrobiota bacterium]
MRIDRKTLIGFVLLGIAPALNAGDSWVTLGPVIRHNMEIEVTGSSYTQTGAADLPASFFRGAAPSVLGDRGAVRPAPGTGVLPLTGFVDRSFDDGFVNVGSTTGVGMGLAPDHTWFWGYDNASQVDTNANTLSFNIRGPISTYSGDITDVFRESRQSVNVLRDNTIDEDEDITGAGFELMFGRDILVRTGKTYSVIGGVNAIWGESKSIRESPWAADVRNRQVDVTTEHDFTDTWDAHDLYTYLLEDPMGNPVPPRAPGDPGTFNGLPLPSPLIPQVPDSHDRE